jgi:glycosyltransferase involved in cell wall biosynthesis
MSGPAATVVVCTYNRARLLPENVDAVLAQEGVEYEAVYVNDGSTDETAAVLDRYAAAHPHLRALHTANGGPGAARNAGAARARGEWLVFLDDDALPPCDWLRTMLKRRAHHDCRVLCGGIAPYALDTPAEQYLHYRMQRSLGRRARRVRAAPSGNLLAGRALFEKVGGFAETRWGAAEDWDLCLRLRAAGEAIVYDPAATVRHRYQRDWDAALARVRAMGRTGVVMTRAHGGNSHAYVAFNLLRWAASPVWTAWRYPPGLYAAALRMETAFMMARLREYVRPGAA